MSRKEANERRKEKREWRDDPSHPEGGYWYAAEIPEEEHGGTGSVYVNWWCRCPRCTTANTERQQRQRESKRKLAAVEAERKRNIQALPETMVVGVSRGLGPRERKTRSSVVRHRHSSMLRRMVHSRSQARSTDARDMGRLHQDCSGTDRS